MIENLKNIELNDDSQIDKNWLKDENHLVLKELEKKGGSIYMNLKAEIFYRLSPNDSYVTTKDYRVLNNIFTNFLEMDVDFSTFNKKIKAKDDLDEEILVKPEDLIMVSGTTFEPNNKEEFIEQENGTYLRNEFKASEYLQMKGDEIDFIRFRFEKSKTFYFLLHLLNHDYQRVQWVINWIAYFFQGLKKSQVALVLIGIQGTGKNVFFNQIIRPLFGEVYTKAINDKSLNTKYKAALVKNSLFLNLDEISANTSLSDSQKNFLKALITNLSATLEEKFKNLEEEILLHAQVLITSNEAYAVEIEPNDRRFTVFSTGDTLLSTNFLGLGSYEALSDVLKSELKMVACYLKVYPVDVQMANTVLCTLEKDEMIYQYEMKQQTIAIKQQKILQPRVTKLQKNLNEYVYAIRSQNIKFFEPIMFENRELFQSIYSDFCNNVFRVENLLPVYKALYGTTSIKTNSELLRELQKIDNNMFNTFNLIIMDLNSIKKEFFRIPQYFTRF